MNKVKMKELISHEDSNNECSNDTLEPQAQKQPTTEHEDSKDKDLKENKDMGKWAPDTLVIGCGGARGYLYLGALHRLYATHYLEKITTYVGVSIGSILCFLLAAGFTPRQVWNEVKYLQTQELISMSSDIFKNFGLFKMNKIEERLEKIILPIFGKRPTYEEFFLNTQKDLRVIVSNITQKRKVVFCKDSHPKMDVIKTLCMSSSIPLLFEPYKYENLEFNDGANYTTYPIQEVDDGLRQILGLYIDDDMIDDTLFSKLNKILTGSWDGKRDETIQRSSAHCKHIRIYSNFLDTTGITLNMDKKIMLLSSGDTSATLWVQEQEHMPKEKPSYTFLRAVVDYDEDFNTRTHFEESDEEHEFEEMPVVPISFYKNKGKNIKMSESRNEKNKNLAVSNANVSESNNRLDNEPETIDDTEYNTEFLN